MFRIEEKRDKIPALLTALLYLLIPLDYILPHFGNATVVTLTSIAIIVYGLFCVIIKKNGKIFFPHESASLVVLLVVFLLSIVWAINRDVVFSRFVTIANTFLLYIFIAQFRYDKKTLEMIENASILGATILAVWVYRNIDLDLVYAGYRLRFSQLGSEFFSDPNGLGGRIMFPLVIAINRVFYNTKTFLRMLYILLIVAFSYILFLTGSRAGVIAIAAAAIVFSLQGFEKKKSGLLIGIIIFLLAVYFFAPRFLPEHIIGRIFNVEKYREVSEIEGDRIDIWKHIVTDLFVASPLFGYGGGCSAYALAQFYGHIKAVHNSYLLVLCEVGLLGFLPLMYFVIGQFREAISLREYSTTILPAIIAIHLIALTLDAFTEKYLWAIFIYIHIIGCCYEEERTSQNTGIERF